jgi:fatty acid desaturase
MNVFLHYIDTPQVQAVYANASALWNGRQAKLNQRLQEAGVPVQVRGMESVWAVVFEQPGRYHWLLQYYLREQGIALSWVGSGRMIFSFNFDDQTFDMFCERFVAGAIAMQSDAWWYNHAAQSHRAIRRQVLKDYVAFPVLAGPFAPFVFTGTMTANLVRNIWSYAIIFCGHFPEGVQEFSVEQTRNETRGQWYYRQILGSANLTGGKLFHIMSGNLSHQIEHHLFPDIPARRYAEIAPQVREICERYGLPYHAGPLPKQFASVVRKIVRLALPSRGPAKPVAAPQPLAA